MTRYSDSYTEYIWQQLKHRMTLDELKITGKTYNYEKEFQADISKIITNIPNYWHYKIRDDSRDYKPFDFVLIKNNTPYAVELKLLKTKGINKNTIVRLLEIRQVSNLLAVHKAGGQAFVIVYHNESQNTYIYNIIELLEIIKQKWDI